MRIIRAPFTAAIVAMLAFAAAADDAAEIQQIKDVRAASNDAIARHDVAAIVSYLDEEYQVTTSLGQLLQGTAGEADGWQQLIDSRRNLVYVRTPEALEISDDYPLASETGTWTGSWTTAAGPVRTGGRYAAMWRKTGATWKIRSELFVALFCDGADCP